MANNKEDEESKGSNKKILPEFKEDSHSSEFEAELGYDSFESEDEKKKKEEKKRKEEEKKKQEKKEEEEEEEEESDDDKDVDSDVSKDEDFNKLNEYLNLRKKRERENNPSYELEERLENILRKKNRMTEDEIIGELKKVCKMEDIEKYFETVLDNITNNFTENDGEKYYYLKN